MKRASPVVPAAARRYGPAGPAPRRERLAGEEPLQIRLEHGGSTTPLVTTMRTPGSDFELVAGLLLAEGVVDRPEQLLGMRYCREVPVAERHNVVLVRLAPDARPPDAERRHLFTATAACGVCGQGRIASLHERGCAFLDDPVAVPASRIAALPGRLRSAQPLFDRTGGLHAAGLFDPAGHPLVVREDVGRHNALDKVYGWAFLEGRLPLSGHLVCVSGRVGYELVQKSVVARVPVLAAVSAPSSLAVEVARRFGMTLAAFVRDGSFNVYAGTDRVIDDLGAADASAPTAPSVDARGAHAAGPGTPTRVDAA